VLASSYSVVVFAAACRGVEFSCSARIVVNGDSCTRYHADRDLSATRSPCTAGFSLRDQAPRRKVKPGVWQERSVLSEPMQLFSRNALPKNSLLQEGDRFEQAWCLD
jgi:hypothetical protein